MKGKSIIYSSLLKHGHINFSLEILEYCEQSSLLIREQYYLDLLKPEYNICKVAGSSLGRKHSTETILKIKKYKHSIEAQNKMKIKAKVVLKIILIMILIKTSVNLLYIMLLNI